MFQVLKYFFSFCNIFFQKKVLFMYVNIIGIEMRLFLGRKGPRSHSEQKAILAKQFDKLGMDLGKIKIITRQSEDFSVSKDDSKSILISSRDDFFTVTLIIENKPYLSIAAKLDYSKVEEIQKVLSYLSGMAGERNNQIIVDECAEELQTSKKIPTSIPGFGIGKHGGNGYMSSIRNRALYDMEELTEGFGTIGAKVDRGLDSIGVARSSSKKTNQIEVA